MVLAPSKCLFMWIKRVISKSIHAISKIIFILGLYKFVACLECISRNGLSFGHSEWDPRSVKEELTKRVKARVVWVAAWRNLEIHTIPVKWNRLARKKYSLQKRGKTISSIYIGRQLPCLRAMLFYWKSWAVAGWQT